MADSKQTRPRPRSETSTAILVGLAVGFLSFLLVFGIDRAMGTDPVYTWPAGDQAQHIAGAYAYLDGAWSFPIFQTDRINHPAGVNIIFTDSAPFAGLVAKILHSLTGLRFNYLGAWFCVLWVGQAAAAAYLARQLGLRHPVFYACAALFGLTFPAFLNRHFHLALGSHFLLLAALGLYFQTVRAAFSWRTTGIWALLLGVAIWTHAYLFLMGAAIFVAAQGDAVLRRNCRPLQALAATVAVLLVCVALALVGGYQTVGDTGAIGYGSFRLDLLAYVWPYGSAILPVPLIFEIQSAFEGYNYLGLGGLAAIAAMPFLPRGFGPASRLKRHVLLLACILGMLAFAISNTVSLGGHWLVQIPIATDGFPFSTFRASGRFGWPLGYLAVFGSLALLLRFLWSRSPRAALIVALVLTALQAGDSLSLLRGIQEGWSTPSKKRFEDAILTAGSVHFEPPIDCIADGPTQNAAIEVLAIAARAGKLADSAHTARTAGLDCSRPPRRPPAGSATVFIPGSPAANLYSGGMDCRRGARLLVCVDRDGG